MEPRSARAPFPLSRSRDSKFLFLAPFQIRFPSVSELSALCSTRIAPDERGSARERERGQKSSRPEKRLLRVYVPRGKYVRIPSLSFSSRECWCVYKCVWVWRKGDVSRDMESFRKVNLATASSSFRITRPSERERG